MVKKLKQMADKQFGSGGRVFDSAIAGQVKDSAQQIWLAGMGAFARAQAEGSKVFETLVKEGATLQKNTQSAAEDKISEVTHKMSSMAGDVQAKAGQHWDKLETIFEDRTAKALNKLGVPSAKDVDALMSRIDELSAKVAKLSRAAPAKAASKKNATSASESAKTTSGKSASAKTASARSKATAKPAAKRATARRTAA